MTIHSRAFWLYLACLLALGLGLIWGILATYHHPSIWCGDSMIVLDTDTTSTSVQWWRGQVTVWFNSPCNEWRIFPPW